MNKKIMGLIIANIGLFIMIIPLSLIVMNDIKQTTSLSKWLDYQQQHSQKLMKERFLVENLSIQKEIVDVFNPESKTSNQRNKIDMDNTIGNLTIPKFNQSFPLYLNASNEKLSKGVATLEGTPAPAGKIGERPVIAGHRTNYNEISFFFLPELKPGDEIYLSAFDQNFVYRVRDTQTIDQYDFNKLNPEKNVDMITLLTCTHAPQYDKRLIVNATRKYQQKKTRQSINVFTYVFMSNTPWTFKFKRYFPYFLLSVLMIVFIFINTRSLKRAKKSE